MRNCHNLPHTWISFIRPTLSLFGPTKGHPRGLSWPAKAWSIDQVLVNFHPLFPYARNVWILENVDFVFLVFHCIDQVHFSCLLIKLIEWYSKLQDHLRLSINLIKALANDIQNSIMQYANENACLTKVYVYKTWSFRQGCHNSPPQKINFFLKISLPIPCPLDTIVPLIHQDY